MIRPLPRAPIHHCENKWAFFNGFLFSTNWHVLPRTRVHIAPRGRKPKTFSIVNVTRRDNNIRYILNDAYHLLRKNCPRDQQCLLFSPSNNSSEETNRMIITQLYYTYNTIVFRYL